MVAKDFGYYKLQYGDNNIIVRQTFKRKLKIIEVGDTRTKPFPIDFRDLTGILSCSSIYIFIVILCLIQFPAWWLPSSRRSSTSVYLRLRHDGLYGDPSEIGFILLLDELLQKCLLLADGLGIFLFILTTVNTCRDTKFEETFITNINRHFKVYSPPRPLPPPEHG